MADYKGNITGAQIDALPGRVSTVEKSASDNAYEILKLKAKKPVTSINNTQPDDNGNIVVSGSITEEQAALINRAVSVEQDITDLELKVGNLENCGLSVVDGELCCTYNV